MAFAIIAPARHRPDGAVGLRQHHRRLRDAVTFAGFAERTLDGIVDHALQTGIDRAAHDEAAVAIRHLPLHLLEGPVEEIVRRLAIILAHDIGRRAAGGQHLPLRHEAGIDHVGQHLVGAGARGGQVHMRRVAGRGLVEAGEHRGFGEVEIGDLLAEIELGGRRGAEIAATHICTVEIELQDVVLGEVRLQPEREEGFLDLAVDGALVGKEEVLGELLRDRRTTLDDVVGAEVLEQRPRRTDDVDAEMRIEAAVLGGERRLDQAVRHLLQRHRIGMAHAALADLGAVAIEKGDGIVLLGHPVAARRVEGRQREGQHHHAGAGAEGQPVADELDRNAEDAADAEAPHEARGGLGGLGDIAPEIIGARIDECVDLDQPQAAAPPEHRPFGHRPCEGRLAARLRLLLRRRGGEGGGRIAAAQRAHELAGRLGRGAGLQRRQPSLAAPAGEDRPGHDGLEDARHGLFRDEGTGDLAEAVPNRNGKLLGPPGRRGSIKDTQLSCPFKAAARPVARKARSGSA